MAIAQKKTARKKTPLESLLSEEQVNRLINYLIDREESVYASLTEYRQKRRIYERQMNDDFEWRRRGEAPGRADSFDNYRGKMENDIFSKQNDSLNIVGGFAAFMTARTVDDIFGTDPFYSIAPEGSEDALQADTMQKHSEWKLHKSNWKQSQIEGIDLIYGLGEAVTKTTWHREVDVYEERAEVLMSTSGDPIRHPATLDYIKRSDVVEGAIGEEVVYTVDGLMIPASQAKWVEMDIERTNVSYENVKAHVLHFGDLIIPQNAGCVHEADFVGQRCQMRLNEMARMFELDDDTINMLKTDPNEPFTEEKKPIEHLGENWEAEPAQDDLNPIVGFIEAWVKYDPVGDGRTRRMYVIYSSLHRKILKMDYIANVTPKGEIPFHVGVAYPVKGRWYGRGFYEIYEKAQEYIDRQFSNVGYRNRFHSNPVTFFNPNAVVMTDDEDFFVLRPGKTYELAAKYTKDDAISTFTLPDLDERTWQLMQMMIQIIQVRSGITSAAQGEVSSLPSTSTATGIESILQSASTLARMPMNCIKVSLEKGLLYALKLIYSNMSIDETFSYFESDAQKVGVLQINDVKNIDLNVRLLLTRFKERENLEQATKAIEIVSQYLSIPEPEKDAVRPLFIQALRSLGFDQADMIIRPAIQPMPVAAGIEVAPSEAAPYETVDQTAFA